MHFLPFRIMNLSYWLLQKKTATFHVKKDIKRKTGGMSFVIRSRSKEGWWLQTTRTSTVQCMILIINFDFDKLYLPLEWFTHGSFIAWFSIVSYSGDFSTRSLGLNWFLNQQSIPIFLPLNEQNWLIEDHGSALVWPHLWSTVVLILGNAHLCLKSWYQQIIFSFDLFLVARDTTKIRPFFRE